MGVIEPPLKVRTTSLMGVVELAPKVRMTSVRGVTTLISQARLTALIGQVGLDPAAPKVTLARQDLAVTPGCPVQLGATGVPTTPAVVVAWTWRLLSKTGGSPDPILADTDKATAYFEARPTGREKTYVMGVQAVDSVGRRSPEAAVSIVVEGADMLAATTAGWVPASLGWSGEQVVL
jgi:hypothetical protein